ncbi:ComEC/Rec2 family competence protein [Maribacter sp. 2304DJ31-5]|uniref:ComEC/Rec2 family competence protein n=1 Tax=Maribacter sp. 2304DJ31-5 TaxID=3386273 RepID=UPI0039BC7C4C
MSIKNYWLALFIFCSFLSCNTRVTVDESKNNQSNSTKADYLLKWEEGFLDIHHINTGSGDTSFMVLPDGTTLLFDAGNLNKAEFEEHVGPLKATAPVPNDSLSAAGWIARYIKNLFPKNIEPTIDYALISHFHSDHYGSLMELGENLKIKKIIDRDYPDYDFPFDIRKQLSSDRTFQEYLAFIEENPVEVASLQVGKSSQISLLNTPDYPDFKVIGVKSNATIWTGKGEDTFEYFTKEEMISYYKGRYNENPLSLAIKISYGNFDYFTGGDNTGLQGYGHPEWFDVEAPMAKAVGKVEAMTLNHHGNRDATNGFFVETLDPKVVVQQLWCSDHPGQEVYQRLIYKDGEMEERDIFSTNMHPETLVTYGPWFKDNYKSTQGHVVIRVLPKGNQYYVYVLEEENMAIKQKHGPYVTK